MNVHLCCVTAWRGLPPTSARTLPRQLWPLITSHSVATMANYGQLWRKLWPLISHHLAHCCTIFQRSISERSSCWATMASHHLPALHLSFSGQFPLRSFFWQGLPLNPKTCCPHVWPLKYSYQLHLSPFSFPAWLIFPSSTNSRQLNIVLMYEPQQTSQPTLASD